VRGPAQEGEFESLFRGSRRVQWMGNGGLVGMTEERFVVHLVSLAGKCQP
jgi:hypothetical protein